MTQDDRDLAERLCLALPDCVGLSHDTIECLMRLYPDQFQNFAIEARELITAELAAKGMSSYLAVQLENGIRLISDVDFLPAFATAAAQIKMARAENERLREALNKTQIGVNHIATYRTDKWPEAGTDHEIALRILCATQEYDMWCCWNAAIQARAALSATDAREDG